MSNTRIVGNTVATFISQTVFDTVVTILAKDNIICDEHKQIGLDIHVTFTKLKHVYNINYLDISHDHNSDEWENHVEGTINMTIRLACAVCTLQTTRTSPNIVW